MKINLSRHEQILASDLVDVQFDITSNIVLKRDKSKDLKKKKREREEKLERKKEKGEKRKRTKKKEEKEKLRRKRKKKTRFFGILSSIIFPKKKHQSY